MPSPHDAFFMSLLYSESKVVRSAQCYEQARTGKSWSCPTG